jgi:4-aminobutyrate aminotransferase-like enzyme
MWAVEHWDVVPDLMVIGKGLSGGSMPIAAVSGKAPLMDRAEAFVSSTYSGHPAACAAAMKTIEILERDRVIEHAAALGRLGLERLRAMQEKYAVIGEVRGLGLWLAVEFVRDRATRERDRDAEMEVNADCLRNGLYLIHDNIAWFARLQPPLNIERDLFVQGLDILEEAIAAADARRRR